MPSDYEIALKLQRDMDAELADLEEVFGGEKVC